MGTKPTSPAAYDAFAWVYDKHWGNVFLPTVLPILENIVFRRLRKGARILDLCCGTGQLTRELNKLGYRVSGVDGSSQMLRYARRNARGVRFIQADARAFALPARYDAVVSVFDSLNHIMKLSELGEVFKHVHAVLKPGGLLLFDLNTEPGYEHEWQGDFTIVESDHVCVQRLVYNYGARVALFDSTVFRLQKGAWHRTDLKLYQKCHDPARVKTQLRKAGFRDIEVFGFDSHFGVQPLKPEMRRAFFFCRR
jgi:SAM-dependent methyltransferase